MKLFLSYNSKNRAFVNSIDNNLNQNGYEVFFDKESISAGAVWAKVIQNGIEASDSSLVFMGDEGIGE
jgi:TIR domain